MAGTGTSAGSDAIPLFRDDRFFPEGFMRRVVADRLGIEPEAMPGGHMAMLSHPVELVDLLTIGH